MATAQVEAGAASRTVAEFQALWGALLPRERRRVVEILVARTVVASDGGPAVVTLHPRA